MLPLVIKILCIIISIIISKALFWKSNEYEADAMLASSDHDFRKSDIYEALESLCFILGFVVAGITIVYIGYMLYKAGGCI